MVYNELLPPGERLCAYSTRERLQACMAKQMALKMAIALECFVTVLACQRP